MEDQSDHQNGTLMVKKGDLSDLLVPHLTVKPIQELLGKD